MCFCREERGVVGYSLGLMIGGYYCLKVGHSFSWNVYIEDTGLGIKRREQDVVLSCIARKKTGHWYGQVLL